MHGRHLAMDETATVQFAEDAENAAGAMDVFNMVLLGRRRHLAQAGHLARNTVDVRHAEIDAGFAGDGQQMQDRVGRAAHGDVERHGVLEGGEGGNVARTDAGVVLLVVPTAEIDDAPAGVQKQFLAAGVRGDQCAVARQREAERFGQAVHRVGSEHPRTRAAGRAGGALD